MGMNSEVLKMKAEHVRDMTGSHFSMLCLRLLTAGENLFAAVSRMFELRMVRFV